MGNRNKFLAAMAALAVVSACTGRQASEGPAALGPSGLALSMNLSVSPDSISQDGASQASIVVTATDANGQPKAGVVVRLETQVGGVSQDFGKLSARTIVTGT